MCVNHHKIGIIAVYLLNTSDLLYLNLAHSYNVLAYIHEYDKVFQLLKIINWLYKSK